MLKVSCASTGFQELVTGTVSQLYQPLAMAMCR